MSEARTFSVQAISSRAVSRMPSHPCSRRKSRSQANFSARVCPGSTVKTGVCGTAGRSVHRRLSRSGTLMTVPGRDWAKSTLTHSPSTTTRPSVPNCSSSHCGMGTCSGTRILWRTTPVPASRCSAWMK